MGGHNCGIDLECKSNEVFTDVWLSVDAGLTWSCRTSNYNPGITEKYSRGIGRFVSATLTHDDTVFLIGGQKPNTTMGLSTIWMSYGGPVDLQKPGGEYVYLPQSHETSPVNSPVKLYFGEKILIGSGALQVTDLASLSTS